MTTDATPKELGLMKLAGLRKHQLADITDRLDQSIITASQMLLKLGGTDAVKEYRMGLGGVLPGYCLTTIGEYENKKGYKSQAHFNCWMTYIGSTKKLGDKPIYTLTYLKNTPKNWEDGCFGIIRETGEVFPIEKTA